MIDREPLPEGFTVLACVAKSRDSAISAPMGLVALLVHFEFHLKRRGARIFKSIVKKSSWNWVIVLIQLAFFHVQKSSFFPELAPFFALIRYPGDCRKIRDTFPFLGVGSFTLAALETLWGIYILSWAKARKNILIARLLLTMLRGLARIMPSHGGFSREVQRRCGVNGGSAERCRKVLL